MFVMMIICKFEVIMLLSSFDGLKARAHIRALKPTLKTEYSVLRVGLRALICAGCFGHDKSQFLGP
jgi:hypothetical protein